MNKEKKKQPFVMNKFFNYALWACVALLFFGTFVYLYRKSRPEKEHFEAVTPAMMDISRKTIVTGKIVPRNEISIKPQIGGIITTLCKEAGQMVQAGEVIAKVSVIPDMSSLSSAQSRVRLAGINLEQSNVDYNRMKALHDKELVSAEEYDRALQAFNQAKAEYDAAEDALEVIKTGVSKSNASSSSTLIRSTVTGLILDIPVKVGNSVIPSNTFNDGTTIATVANMKDLIFDGNVDETEVGTLEVGTPVSITIGALQGLKLDATLEYVSPKAVESNGANQFEIKAAIVVPEGKNIRSGYSANAEIVLERALNVLAIPEKTITFSGDSTFVYVTQKDSSYTRRAITTGLSDGVNIEVKEGISLNETLRGNKIIKSK